MYFRYCDALLTLTSYAFRSFVSVSMSVNQFLGFDHANPPAIFFGALVQHRRRNVNKICYITNIEAVVFVLLAANVPVASPVAGAIADTTSFKPFGAYLIRGY